MFRRNDNRFLRVSSLFCVIAAAMAWWSFPAHADDVADYLERHGLKSLLAAHLELQIDTVREDDRGDLILRLATVYAELLESNTDQAQRESLEQRSRALLDKAPAAGADELRLALLRTAYRSAEKIAENHRLRFASATEVESARASLADISEQAATLRQRVKHSVEVNDRRLSRASGTQAIQISESGERSQSLLTQCTFLNAWSLYYLSWLHGRATEAQLAEPLFAEVLQTESLTPQPEDVSIDLRGSEAIARSILGMALCKSLTSSSATAISWLRLLEHQNAFESLREQLPAWRLAVHLDHREYQQVRDLLTDEAKDRETRAKTFTVIPVTWLRLVTVRALEDRVSSALAADVAQTMIMELAARGELSQVHDLANRFGVDALGAKGFALRYVRALLEYQNARAVHASETPTLEDRVVAMYAKAAEQLQSALAEGDASQHPQATCSCRMLIGWCSFFRSRYLDAADAFEQAWMCAAGLKSGGSSSAQPSPAPQTAAVSSSGAEALWMAIVSLDKLNEPTPLASIQTRLASLTNSFIEHFPADDRSATLRLRRAIASTEISEKLADELLAIPANSGAYASARQKAADVLYQLFRAANTPDQRQWHAGRYLAIALSMIAAATSTTDTDGAAKPPTVAADVILRCRQILEVALTEGIDRGDAARETLERLFQWRDDAAVDWTVLQDEVDCRVVQERILADDLGAATRSAQALWDRSSESIWSRLANRAMFKHGHALWKQSIATQDKLQAAELVTKYGGRVLREFQGADDPVNQSGALGYHVAVAEASMTLWQERGSAEDGRRALYLYERLLAARPQNASFLRSMAILSGKIGNVDTAMDCWRRLAAGSQPGTPPWYEAKFHLIQLLANTDPARAREVMDQHKILNPEYGPEPWGAMLKGLDLQISLTAPAASASPDSSSP